MSGEIERPTATPAQFKAVASAIRLRILRLCNVTPRTNKELAELLERDPATVLHHVRLLVKADLLEPLEVRQGPSGAYEKPYRSTGLSWRLDFGGAVLDDDEAPGEVAMLRAFQDELTRSGTASIAVMSRFQLHLTEEEASGFHRRLQELLDEYAAYGPATDRVTYGGILATHRSPDPPAPATD